MLSDLSDAATANVSRQCQGGIVGTKTFWPQWRRNYGDRGYIVPPSSGLVPRVPPQVKDAAYVNILSKRL